MLQEVLMVVRGMRDNGKNFVCQAYKHTLTASEAYCMF